ncbi:heterokaryon incompatibility protein-domain-containing protein [Bisporella sp. PMI_857]|nr:heterokaryon incompatibility protein-domain-containing protein [Bisporella sp. PMI_857]
MPQFKYRALEVPDKQIRLIQLLPRRHVGAKNLEDCEASKLLLGSTRLGHRSSDSGPMECTMHRIWLNDKEKPIPEFVAMSYTWGKPPTRTKPIIIDGATLLITESLDTMLRHVQSDTDMLTLWIDQLCIDQDNIEEKNLQVPLMEEIYPAAVKTIVWLGPADQNSDAIMDFLANVGKETFEFGMMDIQLADVPTFLDESEENDPLNGIKRKLRLLLKRVGSAFPLVELAALIARPWFYRVWVVQEVALGREVEFRCGEKVITYEHLRAALLFHVFYNTYMTNGLQVSSISGGAVESQTAKLLEDLNLIDTAPIFSMLRARRKYQTRTGDMAETLFTLLRNNGICSADLNRLEATDPRDMIFGFFGLASDVDELGIKVDYGKSCVDLFAEVGRELVKQGYVDILALSQEPKVLSSEDGRRLPSWAPDWTGIIIKPKGEVSEFSRPFSASGSTQASGVEKACPSAILGGVLELKGVLVDHIDKVGSVLPKDTRTTPAAERLLFLQEIGSYCQLSAQRGSNIYISSQRQTEAVWRVPIGDTEWGDGAQPFTYRATEKSRQGHELIFSLFTMIEQVRKQEDMLTQMINARSTETATAGILDNSNDPDIVSARNELLISSIPLREMIKNIDNPAAMSYMAMMDTQKNRRPFVSSKGYIGLGPADMQAKDIICLFLGAKFPYILRSRKDGGFLFVGEAYCDGIMDGEFMDQNPVMETFKLF